METMATTIFKQDSGKYEYTFSIVHPSEIWKVINDYQLAIKHQSTEACAHWMLFITEEGLTSYARWRFFTLNL